MNKKYFFGISLNVLILGLVSFLNDMSSEMIMPILPMFITALGGGSIAVGLIGGLRDSISNVLKVFCGYWSDKTGKRKTFISSGYTLSSVFKFMLVFSRTWEHVLLFASSERIGKGLRTAPRDAIISESMPKSKGKGFGIHRALDTLGAIVGSLIVFFLFWFLKFDFRTIILIASMIALTSLIPLYFVKEKKKKQQNITLRVSLKNLPRDLKFFLLISFVFYLANFSYMFFILRAQEYFTGRYSIGIPILLYALFNVFYAGLSEPFGALSDRIGREKIIALGYLLFSLTSLGFIFSNSLPMFMVLFAFYGITYAMIDGNQRAFVSDISSEKFRATALGTFHTTIGIASLPASMLAGILWQINPSITFAYGSLVSLIAVVLFIYKFY
ncbi:MAG: MFS transporter [Candidatus Aenigmarchaeota archaeon]|nr:MFS transporter [Candidatus Aenigmarchaeota archaeon]